MIVFMCILGIMHIFSVYIVTQAPLILVDIKIVGKKDATTEDSYTSLLLLMTPTPKKEGTWIY